MSAAVLDRLLARDIVFVTGKGGVGKTTVATALATAAAARGRRTIVAEVAARADAGRRLGPGDFGVFEEREVAPGLHHISVDPDHAMEEYLVDQLPVRAAADALVRSKVFTYLAAATPGMRELLTAGKLWELAQPVRRTPGAEPYDLVVVDAPATGHGLALLAAPRTFADTARVGPIARQGRIIEATFADPRRTGVVAVAIAEETPVSETLLLRDGLRRGAGLDLDAVLVNAMIPGPLRAPELAALDGAAAARAAGGTGRAVRVALHATRAQHERARRQRAQLGRLRRGIGGELPVLTLPLLGADADVTAVLARRLAG